MAVSLSTRLLKRLKKSNSPLWAWSGEIKGMNRKIAVFAAAVAAFAFTATAAQAAHRHKDFRLKAVSIGVGAASTAAYFGFNNWHWKWQGNAVISQGGAIAITTVGCMAVSPIVGTIVVNRELTQREAHVMAASCIVPIVGGWLVNAAYDAHPEWEPGAKPHKMRHHHKKKM
jgi:hypothetical protein